MVDSIPNIQLGEAAKILGICWKTARKWAETGQLRAAKVGGRYRTKLEWIEQTVKPCGPPQMESKGEKTSDNKQATCIIATRYGIKVLGSKLHREI